MRSWFSNLSTDHWFSITTIIAVLLGPILAVWITRIIDDRRAQQARKMDVFRTLMRTRRTPIHFDHVGALNLVEVEFVDHPKVVEAWKSYLKNLGEELPPLEQKDRYDKALKDRDALLTKLIYEVSVVLKFKVQQLDILEGNYVPQGWHDDDSEQKLVRRHLIDVLSGRAPLTIRPEMTQIPNSPYPPAPAQTGAMDGEAVEASPDQGN